MKKRTLICEFCGQAKYKTQAHRFCSRKCRFDMLSSQRREQFWDNVSKTDGCWTWTGAKDWSGYGAFKLTNVQYRAHRLAYELTHGPFDPSLYVCHRCDNPSCVNPSHLFLGTALDNNRDCVAKGRGIKGRRIARSHHGENNPNAVLTPGQVSDTRAALAAGENRNRLAKQYGVTWTTIEAIRTGRRWKMTA